MYNVFLLDDYEFINLNDPAVDYPRILSGQMNSESDKIDSFTFTINQENPGYDRLNTFTTQVFVMSYYDGQYIFYGRVINVEEKQDADGIGVEKAVTCESNKGFLHDSCVYTFNTGTTITGTPKEVLSKLLDSHNMQVNTVPTSNEFSAGWWKNFFVGQIDDDVANIVKSVKETKKQTKHKTLSVGDSARIKSSAVYFSPSHHPSGLRIADFAKERVNRVEAYDEPRNAYFLSYQGVKIGWIKGEDIYETETVITTQSGNKIISESRQVSLEVSLEMDTFEAISKLCEICNCRFTTSYIDGYLKVNLIGQSHGDFNQTEVTVGDNLISMSRLNKVNDVYSIIIPIGRYQKEEKEGEGE
ncbi:hypothetical protein QP248_02625 [Aerococcus sp. UMB8608]|uniref:Prophage tail endopeptidase domain-containing protein n=2 Tax=Aerococcus TaxID=1375 RepID=A0A109RDT2_9LACT|nr:MULTISPECIES: hypothetical protein [Aerococcus]AMB94896.1 hypothetical protein AWM72_09075 [Aerococcus sanguinicola]MDK6679344.1 hypothetical protein [Aerococcus sp. UMB8608]MDK6685814.1 hypothetical protein [Aerococcus sp. UMB8623]OFT95881.1 hypothetical protein HMPREF3090_03410 [Aerococcus sp. HMSC23C02]